MIHTIINVFSISACIEYDMETVESKIFYLRNKILKYYNYDNIYCNIPCPFDMYDVIFLRPYKSDHNTMFCMLNNITQNKGHTPVQNGNF